MRRYAFTMLELVFVIVIMGVLGKFGVEFLAQAYKSFIFSSVNYTLQSNSATTVEFISSRLQHRIKDSVIIRENPLPTASVPPFRDLASAVNGTSYKVLEWVAADVDGFRGMQTPYWSAIIDLDASNGNFLFSPATDTGEINTLINKLSHGLSGIDDAALYFADATSDFTQYGWDGNALDTQNFVMHPIKQNPTNLEQFFPRKGSDGSTNSFNGVEVSEYYKLAWTANAIVLDPYDDVTTHKGTLRFYFNYQPWNGETYRDGLSFTLMENVSTFRALGIGSIIKIQVCTKSDLIAEETYSLCKEKTIF